MILLVVHLAYSNRIIHRLHLLQIILIFLEHFCNLAHYFFVLLIGGKILTVHMQLSLKVKRCAMLLLACKLIHELSNRVVSILLSVKIELVLIKLFRVAIRRCLIILAMVVVTHCHLSLLVNSFLIKPPLLTYLLRFFINLIIYLLLHFRVRSPLLRQRLFKSLCRVLPGRLFGLSGVILHRFIVKILIKIVDHVLVDLIKSLPFLNFCWIPWSWSVVQVIIPRTEKLHGYKSVTTCLVRIAAPLDVDFSGLLYQWSLANLHLLHVIEIRKVFIDLPQEVVLASR